MARHSSERRRPLLPCKSSNTVTLLTLFILGGIANVLPHCAYHAGAQRLTVPTAAALGTGARFAPAPGFYR